MLEFSPTEKVLLPEQYEPGQKWIESALHTACREAGGSMGRIEWRPDFENTGCRLEVEINGKQVCWTFSYEDVSDCRNNLNIQRKIQRRLRGRKA